MGQDVLPYRILGAVSGTGRVAASGEASPQLTPRNARSAGISLVAGNRSRDVFWLGGTAQENVTAPWLREVTRHGWLSRRRERELAQLRIDALGVVPPDPDKRVGTLSGGESSRNFRSHAGQGGPSACSWCMSPLRASTWLPGSKS